MKSRTFVLLLCLLAVAILRIAHQAAAQRVRPGKVEAMDATRDKEGDHPRTTTIDGPKKITCMGAISETPNTHPACHVVAPGFSGTVKVGETIDATGAGTVTLSCTGQGFLRCNARIT